MGQSWHSPVGFWFSFCSRQRPAGQFASLGVGDGVGAGVGLDVSNGVGTAVGDGVGTTVGDGVGAAVGDGVGDGASWHCSSVHWHL